MGRLSTKVALVSGGSSGLGAAHSRAIVAEGGKVIIGDIADDAGEALARELGDNATFVHLDVTSRDSWREAVYSAVSTYGSLSVLVNNAGIISGGTLGEYSLESWQQVIDVNLTGTFLGMSAAVESLKASAPSSIVNMSSIAGMQGTAGFHAYCAAKFGIRGITKSSALELAPFGIRVNSVHPGTIRTPMTAGVPESIARNCAMRRFGEASEIAQLVVFLASDDSSFSTGGEFTADGGEGAGVVRD
jgi:3alpha(or 20beta)-hydroxysteroid dehydrogenase